MRDLKNARYMYGGYPLDPAGFVQLDEGGVPRQFASVLGYSSVTRLGVGAASAQSAAIAGSVVLLHASVKCYVIAGADPTATVTGAIPLEAGEKFHLAIDSGQKIAAITDGGSGYLHIAVAA